MDTGETSVFVRYGGEGPPLLLLHGHPRTSATWHRVAPLLVERGFTVVCPDLRGYGRSRGPIAYVRSCCALQTSRSSGHGRGHACART
ncbi:alpha/beta fold hydrolase [Streptomyces anulatus]|uniref:alpha/beta fold hydrolase n=1 Tax=Streptomyces anulatus TaxID=1892 RepID=UPI0039A63532